MDKFSLKSKISLILISISNMKSTGLFVKLKGNKVFFENIQSGYFHTAFWLLHQPIQENRFRKLIN